MCRLILSRYAKPNLELIARHMFDTSTCDPDFLKININIKFEKANKIT